jgi:hypothetical protein
MSGQRQGSGGDERSLAAVGRRLWGDDSPLRRALRWVWGDREHIDQEGLLAERTLLVRPRRRPGQDDDGEAAAGPERRSTEPRD